MNVSFSFRTTLAWKKKKEKNKAQLVLSHHKALKMYLLSFSDLYIIINIIIAIIFIIIILMETRLKRKQTHVTRNHSQQASTS